MAKVTVVWTVEQAIEVKTLLESIADVRKHEVASKHLEREYNVRGATGRAEWAEVQRRERVLRGALEALD